MARIRGLAVLTGAAALLLAGCAADHRDKQPPTAPTAVTAQAGSATAAHVMWQPATDNVAVTGYQVWSGGAKVKDVPGSLTMVDVAGLRPSTRYVFTVRAVDAAGNLSPQSTEATATTLSAATQDDRPPSRPTELRGRADGPRAAVLTWRKSSDNLGVASYDVLQGGVKVHSVGGGGTTARITGLRPGVGYAFSVRARDAADNVSPESTAVDVTTPAAPGDGPSTAPTGLSGKARSAADGYYLDLAWTPPETGGQVTDYQVHLDGALATTVVWGAGQPQDRASYSLPIGTEPHASYTVRVRARLPDGDWGELSAPLTVATGAPRR
ncbi:fibronectin type III domain-containing protein [Streptomyces sp. NPDC092296]|uniref:fibronectin type III domain-containing protein n=1 Tax=Streptomyces sp. NPDC092296 TaxID=3366012 RepID=UPI00381E9DC6